MVGLGGELGQELHDGVGVQQLGQRVGRAAVALEVEPAELAVAGRNQDGATVGHLVGEQRQRVGGGDPGPVAVVHGARNPDEGDPLDPGFAQVTHALPERILVEEGRDLGAQAADAGQFGLDDVPEVQDVQLRLHLDGTAVVLLDHAGHHHVPDPALQPGGRGRLAHLVRLLDGTIAAELGVGRHEFERNGVEGHRK